jgi:glycogen synthase
VKELKGLNVLMTTTEYDVVKVGGLSAALTALTHAMKKYVSPHVILPGSGLTPPWKRVTAKQYSGVRMQVFEHEGVNIYTLSNEVLDQREIYPEPQDTRGIGKINDYSARLEEVVGDIDFDIVHMQDFFAYGAMDFFHRMDKPVLLTIHRLHRENPTWFSAEKTALQKADYITVVGESYYKQDEKELFAKHSGRVTSVFNGIDTEFWSVRNSSFYRLARSERRKKMLNDDGLDDGVLFIFVGRFDPVQKGVDVLLRASDQFLADENVRMIIVGVGDKNLEAQSRELEEKYRSKLRVMNELLSMERVRDLYSGADFALIPSIFEPFGLVQLEAMSCECVPIGSRTGGIKDTVVSYDQDREKATGFLVDKGDPQKLLETMRQALDLLNRRSSVIERMRRNGRKHCENVFQWDVAAKRYFEIYSKLLSKVSVKR